MNDHNDREIEDTALHFKALSGRTTRVYTVLLRKCARKNTVLGGQGYTRYTYVIVRQNARHRSMVAKKWES